MALVKLTTKQVATLVNDATKEYLGETAVLQEDLTNVIDMGVAIQNASLYENFTMGLLLKIGMEIYVNRPYKSGFPDIFRTNTEFGQITSKIRGKLDEAQNNQSWSLTNNTSYDDNIYVESTYETKLFAKNDAFEIRKSLPDEQIKGAFRSASDLEKFVAMVFTLVYNSIEVKRETLVQMVINNFTATVINDNNAVRCVKLLTKYNALTSKSLTADQAIIDKGFLAYAGGVIRRYQKLLTRYSSIYNINGADNHTPLELQHLVLLSEFVENCSTYLDSNTFHDEFIKLPYHAEVPYWQGTGTALDGTRKINVKTAGGATVEQDNIIGVLFDHDALGIMEDKPTVRTKYINSAEFTNYWFKQKIAYFNDTNENFIVFLLA